MAVETKDVVKNYKVAIKSALLKSTCDPISKALALSSGDEDTKRMWLDHAFRHFLTSDVMVSGVDLKNCDTYIELSIKAAIFNLCSKTIPIQLLSDMFDVITLDQCEKLFSTIERNIVLWKSEEFFTPIRNNLLRICNDLLRRLSRSQNTVFCGRILLFLAKFFPVSERSGLNVVSEFNLENTTVFSTTDETTDANGDKDSPMEIDLTKEDDIKVEEDQRSLSVDYALYAKFWQLQDFFRNPNQCYNNVKWKTFSTYSTDVLNTFKSYKVDSISGSRQRKTNDENEQFFAKYLTNQNLLQLQLSDSNFRRYILIQFLILFQYLKSTVKFKSDSHVLTDDQNKWIDKVETRIYELMAETPPYGEKFGKSVKHILHREEQWNLWKNQGCKSLISKPPVVEDKKLDAESKDSNNATSKIGSTRKRKAKVGDQIQHARKQGKFLMGNGVLTRLWNQYPDNLDACSAPERDFLPLMDDYFEEAIEQLDPNNQIEEDYKKVNDGQWGWRALRLLAKKSPNFFTYGNNPIAKLPDYLDSILKKMYPIPVSSANTTVSSVTSSNGTKTVKSEVPENLVCTKEQLEKLASNLGEHWPKLMPKLGIDKGEEETLTKAGKDHKERASLMLKKWAEMEGEGATKEEITYVLERLKMSHVLESVFT